MAIDPLRQFLATDLDVDDSVLPPNPQSVDNTPRAEKTYGGKFLAGARAGGQGIAADIEYFKALSNTLLGDEEAAAKNIAEARYKESLAANTLEGIQPFKEFLDEPTWDGFATQVTKGTGQLLPYAIGTISSGFIGGLAATFGKAALSTASQKAAQKLVKDALRKKAQGIATPDEMKLADAAYSTFKRGALTGAFASEFVPLSGSNFSDAIDAGTELDRAQALRAAGLAVPQAAIGTFADVAVLKLLGDVAKKRAVKGGSIYAQLASDIARRTGKTGVIEGSTELLQEGIAVANKLDLDETFTAEDAKLQLAEAAFTGFFGGGALGGGATAGGAAISAVPGAVTSLADPARVATEKVAGVFDKVRRYRDDAQLQRTEETLAKEAVGDVPKGQTQPESAADINAQLSAMVNPTSKKQAVWIAGDEAKYNSRPNKATEITVDGQLAFSAFIPGRGTIVSTSRKIVDEVVASKASDEAIGIALGYSNVKSQSFRGGGPLLVARALDADGNVVSEELASEGTIDAAMEAARGLMPEGGSVQRLDAEQALEERARRFNKEQGPEVSGFDTEKLKEMGEQLKDSFVDSIPDILELFFDDPDAFDAPDQTETPTFGSEFEELSALKAELAMAEEEGEQTIVGSYEPKADPSRVFPNTETSRQAYIEAFGPTDFEAGPLAGVSEATLNKAVEEHKTNRNSVIEIVKNSDGKFEVVRTDFDKLYRFFDRGVEMRLTLPDFISRAVSKAKRGLKTRQSAVTLVSPDGKRNKISLVDLARSGQRLVESRENKPFVGSEPLQSARDGLSEIIGDLLIEGFQIEVLNQPINEVLSGQVDERFNVPVVELRDDSGEITTTIGLADLFNGVEDPAKAQRFLTEDQKAENKRQLRQTYNDPTLRQNVPYQMPRETISEEVVPGDPEYVEGQRTFRQVPLEQAAEGKTETETFAGDPRDDVSPDNREGRAPSTGQGEAGADPVSVPPPQQDPQGFDSPIVSGLINNLLSIVKLKNPPRVFNGARLAQLSDAQLAQIFTDVELPVVKQMLQRFADRPEIGGSYDGKRNIAVINSSGNVLSDAMSAAHEIGHAFFQQEQRDALENNALRPRLIQSYKNHPRHDRYVELYGFEKGFEEWYADQLSRWATKKFINRAAKNMTDKHFKGLAKKLRELWRTMVQGFRARKGPKSPEFEEYIASVIEAKRNAGTLAQVVRGQVKFSRNPPRVFNETGVPELQPFLDPTTPMMREQTATETEVETEQTADETTNRSSTTEPPLSFVEKAMPYEIKEAVIKVGGEALAAHWRRSLQRKSRPLIKLVATADGVLRMHAGNTIADMFYRRSQEDGSGGELGMLRASALQVADFQNDFEDRIGSFDDVEVLDAIAEAASSKEKNELSPKAQEVRTFLEEVYAEYIKESGTNIGFQKDFFPVVLNIMEIEERSEEFKSLILANQPGISPARAEAALHKLRQYAHAVRDDEPIFIDPTNPSAGVEKSIQLTKGIDRQVLQDAGFLQDPEHALVTYLRHVTKRVEFNKATNNGAKLKEELAKLSDEDRQVALEVINAYMGYQTQPIGPIWRKVNSIGQFVQFVSILPFATIASLPDLAGPIINSKEFSLHTFGMAMKEIAARIKNPEEKRQFARDMGLVTHETVANAWVTQAEQDYMDPAIRKMSDTYFRWIGLDYFTKFSREFAAGMGASFITHHARNEFDNPRSERYLRELGLTSEDVTKWVKSGRKLSTPEGKKVKQAIQRFTESSILRPNAAERPIWASDPRWALVWQLKSYFYAYSKVIGGGVLREATTRYAEASQESDVAQLTASLSILALTAVATMPLAMLGMELREYAKWGAAWALPGIEPKTRYFRTDRMDWDEYLFETVDKSGFLGPLSLGVMANQQAEWDGARGAALSILGPSAETINEALENGWRIDRTLKDRLLPGYAVL